MVDEAELTKTINLEMTQTAMQRASHRAKAARWDLDVAVFFVSILAIVVILLFQGIKVEVVTLVAILGLAMGWLMGWRKGKQAYESFYEQELKILEQQSSKSVVNAMEETIEERVQKALRERLR